MNDTKQTMSELRNECKALALEIPKRATREQLEALISADVARTAAELNALVPGIIKRPESDEERAAASSMNASIVPDPDDESLDEAAFRHDEEMFGRQDHDLDVETEQEVADSLALDHGLLTERTDVDPETGELIGTGAASIAANDRKPVVDLGPKPVTMYFPSVRLGDVVVECEHTAWGHQSEGAAKKCAAALATKATAAAQ